MGRTPQKKVQIEHRRTQVADLYAKGWKQAAIAGEQGVSQATISSDLKAIRKEWMESRVRNTDEAIEEGLKCLDAVEREAWDAWQRSQEPAATTRIIQKNGEKRAEKTVRERPGDPQFLQIVLRVLEKRGKLLGLDAAASAALERPDEQAISAKANALAWDFYHMLIDSNSPKPEVIDDDFIERYIAEQMKSRTDATGG